MSADRDPCYDSDTPEALSRRELLEHMKSLEEAHFGSMENVRASGERISVDALVDSMRGKSRKERRAFKSNLMRAVRNESRKAKRVRN